MVKAKVVDADSHIMEPSDLWEKNLGPSLRHRAIRISKDEDGMEYLEIDGKMSGVVNGGGLASFGRLDHEIDPRWEQSQKPGGPDYEDGVPLGARDGEAKLKWMNEHGIDITLLYPSLALGWQDECDDPDLASAYCRVYNDWITDFCSPHPGKLIPIVQVPLLRVENAVDELRRVVKLGARGVYLFPVPVNGIPYGDPYYDPFWSECQEMGIPLGIHVSNTPRHSGSALYKGTFGANTWWLNMMYKPDCMISFTSFFQGSVFERFPELSVGVVEAGCGWIAFWLEQMDFNFSQGPGTTDMKRPPSEYFQRQCWISGEPGEKTFPFMAQLVGAHKLMWGSDYPHEEGHEEPLDELKESIGILSQEDQEKILGGNAMRVYDLPN